MPDQEGAINQLINLQEVDTYLFDYGGVVSFHYCEPWQGNLSSLLEVDPVRVRELLSETSEQGKGYRLGTMSREQFWNEVIRLAGVEEVDMAQLEDNWARSYQIDTRMLSIIGILRKLGKQVGVVMNTDAYRFSHIEKEYQLSTLVDFVISSCKHGVVKPEKEAYVCALKIVNREYTPEKVVYFDDRERNISPCLDIGMKGIVFTDFESFKNLLIKGGVISEKSI